MVTEIYTKKTLLETLEKNLPDDAAIILTDNMMGTWYAANMQPKGKKDNSPKRPFVTGSFGWHANAFQHPDNLDSAYNAYFTIAILAYKGMKELSETAISKIDIASQIPGA